MTGEIVRIGPAELALASGFIVLTGVLSLALGLGLVKDIAVATLRTYAQLIALGFVLRWVFGIGTAPLVVGILLVMTVLAARIVLRRSPDAPSGLMPAAVLSMAVTGFAVTFSVTGLVVGVEPWFSPRYVIPIAGMVLGNSMTGIALTLERVFTDLDARAEEVLVLTALGASEWEAASPSVRSALRAGLIPTLNSMAAAGIVFIPGMMTGQVLGGVDPLLASGYQVVVMLMVAAATGIGSMMAVLLSYGKRFTGEGVFLEKAYRERA